jgi:hypothetical protein
MKKFWRFILAGLFLLFPVAIFAQSGDGTSTSFDVMSLFLSFTTFGAGVLVVTGLITKYILKSLSTTGKEITSWVVALIVGFIGWFLKLGIFNGIEWYSVLIIVISFATGANKVYDTAWIRALLAFLKLAPTPTTTTK